MNYIKNLVILDDKLISQTLNSNVSDVTINEYIYNMKLTLLETKDDIYHGNKWLKQERYHYLGVFFIFISILGFVILSLLKR